MRFPLVTRRHHVREVEQLSKALARRERDLETIENQRDLAWSFLSYNNIVGIHAVTDPDGGTSFRVSFRGNNLTWEPWGPWHE